MEQTLESHFPLDDHLTEEALVNLEEEISTDCGDGIMQSDIMEVYASIVDTQASKLLSKITAQWTLLRHLNGRSIITESIFASRNNKISQPAISEQILLEREEVPSNAPPKILLDRERNKNRLDASDRILSERERKASKLDACDQMLLRRGLLPSSPKPEPEVHISNQLLYEYLLDNI